MNKEAPLLAKPSIVSYSRVYALALCFGNQQLNSWQCFTIIDGYERKERIYTLGGYIRDKIIREKGEKEHYTCASGITPSGTVHIGNFREIISVELVVRALREKGKNVRFIYSWDDYDVFRKVPKNMPEPEMLSTYLRKPITLVPDTLGRAENYARGNEQDVERILPAVGVEPEYIYQAKRYRASEYAQGMRLALEKRDEIRAILDEFRTEPLEKRLVANLCLLQLH